MVALCAGVWLETYSLEFDALALKEKPAMVFQVAVYRREGKQAYRNAAERLR